MPLIVIAAAFVLVSVTAFDAPVLPNATLNQLRLVGDTETAAIQFTPDSTLAAITPLAANVRHPINEGAEPTLKAGLENVDDEKLSPRQNGTRVLMRLHEEEDA